VFGIGIALAWAGAASGVEATYVVVEPLPDADANPLGQEAPHGVVTTEQLRQEGASLLLSRFHNATAVPERDLTWTGGAWPPEPPPPPEEASGLRARRPALEEWLFQHSRVPVVHGLEPDGAPEVDALSTTFVRTEQRRVGYGEVETVEMAYKVEGTLSRAWGGWTRHEGEKVGVVDVDYDLQVTGPDVGTPKRYGAVISGRQRLLVRPGEAMPVWVGERVRITGARSGDDPYPDVFTHERVMQRI